MGVALFVEHCKWKKNMLGNWMPRQPTTNLVCLCSNWFVMSTKSWIGRNWGSTCRGLSCTWHSKKDYISERQLKFRWEIHNNWDALEARSTSFLSQCKALKMMKTQELQGASTPLTPTKALPWTRKGGLTRPPWPPAQNSSEDFELNHSHPCTLHLQFPRICWLNLSTL